MSDWSLPEATFGRKWNQFWLKNVQKWIREIEARTGNAKKSFSLRRWSRFFDFFFLKNGRPRLDPPRAVWTHLVYTPPGDFLNSVFSIWLWTALKQYEFIWSTLRLVIFHMVVSGSETIWIHTVYTPWLWAALKQYEFIRLWAALKQYEFIWLWAALKQYDFIWLWAALKQYEFIWSTPRLVIF